MGKLILAESLISRFKALPIGRRILHGDPLKTNFLRTLLLMLIIIFTSPYAIPSLAAATTSASAPADSENQPLVLQLRWSHQFQFAGYYAAQWMGYYEEEGLNVDIRPAFETDEREILDAALEVHEGRADFGVGAANLLIAQDAGMDLALVASIFQRSAVEYCTLLEDRANTVFDLSRLHIARRPGDLLDLELQALFASEGILPYAERTTDITRDFTLEDLQTGTFEVVPDFLGQISYSAAKAGVPLKVVRPAELGVDFYGDTLFTSQKLAKANPELVERFRRASIKGWLYALEHPQEVSAEITTRYYDPAATPEQKAEFKAFNDFRATKVTELTHYPIVELGNLNPFRWKKMAEAMKSLEMIQTVPDLDAMIFDYDQVKMTQLETTRKNLAILFGALTALMALIFLIDLKRRNVVLKKEIEDRQLAERQLVLSNARYETIFRSSVLGITVTEADGRIRHVNEAWCAMTGYTASELCSMNISQLIAPESREVDRAQHQALMEGRILSYSMEKTYLRKPTRRLAKSQEPMSPNPSAHMPDEAQEIFYGRMVLTRIWDNASDTLLNMSMVTDITREVKEAEAIRRSEARFRGIISQVAKEIGGGIQLSDSPHPPELSMNLEEINLELERLFNHELEENRRKDALIRYQGRMAAMGEMIGSIAHQWRQPLHTLKLVLLNLKDPGNDPAYTEACFVKANRLIQRMSDTIDDFRYFSNPRTEPKTFSVEASVQLVMGLVDEQLRVSGITLESHVADLSPLYGFDNQFSHVLFNLISNAIDALKQNPPGKARRIVLSGQAIDSNLILRVEDTGPGIPPNHVPKIFDPYFTTKEAQGGSGLGLPMAASILESAFGGTLTLADAPEGCAFELRLPLSSETLPLSPGIRQEKGR